MLRVENAQQTLAGTDMNVYPGGYQLLLNLVCASLQVTRVQKLWDKMQEVGIADPEASTFDSLQQLQLQSNSAEQNKSSRCSPWISQHTFAA